LKNNAVIFGDSYSTFDGYIPHGYDSYYPVNWEPGIGVTEVPQTWWQLAAGEADLNILLNDSWSGSTIGYTAYDGYDCSGTSSFIYRLRRLIENGFFAENKVDKVFVFGGTNDSWCGAELGNEQYEDHTESDLYYVLPAVCRFLGLLKQTLPDADLYCMINTDLKPEITSCMEHACEKYGITAVNFGQIDKMYGHPTIQGMKDIANGLLKAMNG